MSRYFGPGNRMMVFGTAGIGNDGELYLSKAAECRANRAAEAYYNGSFNRQTGIILLTGGYSKELKDAPPQEREARLIGRYLIERFGIPKRALLFEDESTSTEENFTKSYEKYPELFEDVISGERKLGLVSHPFHLKRVIRVGEGVLSLPNGWHRELPTWQLDNKDNEVAAMRVWRLGQEAVVRAAAD